ncbi:DUF488 family protein [Bradyrhizobium sp.]|uniref:DUF488 family protein n=1 Tax=Bradyrhizobium sp. TaxID=376 RepID=UPI003C58A7E5
MERRHTHTFFTIGHSTRTIVEFVDLLQESGVGLVIDVRSMPRSRTNPQFKPPKAIYKLAMPLNACEAAFCANDRYRSA